MKTLLIALILAAGAASAQCATDITDNTQNICGTKIFTSGVQIETNSSLRLKGNSYIIGENSVFFGSYAEQFSVAPSFMFQSASTRPNGPMVMFWNGGLPVYSFNADGELLIFGDKPIRRYGHSGAPTVAAYAGQYLTLMGSLPPKYWGHHGALTVRNESVMTAGYLLQLMNDRSGIGAATMYVAQWNYQGGWETQAALSSFELAICDGRDVHPDSTQPSNRYPDDGNPLGCTLNPDGGTHDVSGNICNDWYKATGPGHAMDGNVMPWVVDVRQPCQCDSQFFDGGVASGWRKLSDRSECRP